MGKPRVRLPTDHQPTGHILRDSTMSMVPETLEPYIVLNKALWAEGPLNPAELELMRLRNARKVGCVYCKAVRYGEAKDAPIWLGHGAAALSFLLVGAGLHMVQTVGLALATDLVPEDRQPSVVGLMYVMLLLGMIVSALPSRLRSAPCWPRGGCRRRRPGRPRRTRGPGGRRAGGCGRAGRAGRRPRRRRPRARPCGRGG